MVAVISIVKSLLSKANRWHIVICIFLIVELKLLPGRQLGFLCNDPALSYPYTGDTVSFKWLLSLCTLVPLAIMLTVERVYHDAHRSRRRALRWYKEYIYGFFLNLTLVQTLKLLVGSPRPHFFDTCQPEEALTCKESEFVSSYTCRRAHWLNQSDRSFPSGHTSLAMHAGLFVAYYLFCRKTKTSLPHQHILRTVQTLCVAAALYCSVSRMTDHRHHWWDVLAGAAIAVASVLYAVSLCKNFECSAAKRADSEEHVKQDQETLIGIKDHIGPSDGPIEAKNGGASTPMVHRT